MLSDRIQKVAPSITLAITAKAKELKAAGEKVIGFGAGEPDFGTPEEIKQAAIAAIQAGHTGYTPVDGIPELKAAIQHRFTEDHGLTYQLPQIAVTVGAKQAIYNLLQAAVNPGDGVLVPAPYWVSYPEQVKLAGGVPQVVQTQESNAFSLTADDIRKVVDDSSKILILNSPSNPTGAVIEADELKRIADLVVEHDLFVISDEIYEKLVFDGFKQTSIASISPELYDRTAIVNGVSKAYAMTGWRIGYIAGPEAWVRAAVKLQGQSTSNPCSIAQYASVAALNIDNSIIEKMRLQFERRRTLIVEKLNAISGVHCASPKGAFYVFPNISQAISGRWEDTVAFSKALLEQEKVAVVPGEGFAAPGCIRMSYACSNEDIEEGTNRLGRFLNSE